MGGLGRGLPLSEESAGRGGAITCALVPGLLTDGTGVDRNEDMYFFMSHT